MVIPKEYSREGFTLYGMPFSTVNDELPPYHSKLLFQHYTKNYYHLFDRLLMASAELREVFEAIKGVSDNWYRTARGGVLNMMMRRFTMYCDSPQQYGFYGDFLFAANYSQVKYYLQKFIKVLIKQYGFKNKYYKLFIPKKQLIYLSRIWANEMIPFCQTLLPKWNRLREQNDGKK